MAIVVPTIINDVPVELYIEPTHRKDWYRWDCPKCGYEVKRMASTMPDEPTDRDMMCFRCGWGPESEQFLSMPDRS